LELTDEQTNGQVEDIIRTSGQSRLNQSVYLIGGGIKLKQKLEWRSMERMYIYIPPTTVFRRLTASVNETIIKPHVAAA